MFRTALASTVAAATVAVVNLAAGPAAAPMAQAATTNPCTTIQAASVGGYNWSKMPTTRVCSPTLQAGVSGQAQLVQHKVTINYSPTRTSSVEAAKATVHELTHQVEWRTTNAHRAKLYAFLGIKNPTGDYFAFNDAHYYSGPLALWKQSPRERLAESVVNCTYGSPNHTGMVLVPRSQCTAFLTEFKASLAVAR